VTLVLCPEGGPVLLTIRIRFCCSNFLDSRAEHTWAARFTSLSAFCTVPTLAVKIVSPRRSAFFTYTSEICSLIWSETDAVGTVFITSPQFSSISIKSKHSKQGQARGVRFQKRTSNEGRS